MTAGAQPLAVSGADVRIGDVEPQLAGATASGALWQAALGKRYWRAQERAMVERARELMARFDMSAKEDEYAGNLSGGQKRQRPRGFPGPLTNLGPDFCGAETRA